MSSILLCVTQDESNSNKAHVESRGVETAEVMEGDPKCTKNISASAYDTTNVYELSMVSEELKWVMKEKECFNVDTGKAEK